ncbi:MAG: hypothetical protein KBF93_23690 [Leptospiraceae bacterium]|nr:hypothetical protein [Leptospiraceae bacterium]
METRQCPHCKREIEDLVDPEIRLTANIDFWLNHCLEMIKRGSQFSKIERLPESMRNHPRIIEFYESVPERIKKRKIELNSPLS